MKWKELITIIILIFSISSIYGSEVYSKNERKLIQKINHTKNITCKKRLFNKLNKMVLSDQIMGINKYNF